MLLAAHRLRIMQRKPGHRARLCFAVSARLRCCHGQFTQTHTLLYIQVYTNTVSYVCVRLTETACNQAPRESARKKPPKSAFSTRHADLAAKTAAIDKIPVIAVDPRVKRLQKVVDFSTDDAMRNIVRGRTSRHPVVFQIYCRCVLCS